MKRHFFLGLILIPLVISASYAAVPISDKQNPHNLSNKATHSGPKALAPELGGTDEICIFCHTPHSAAADTPLWSRPDPATMGSFPLYAQPLAIKTDPGKTGYIANPQYPSGASRMCLSCHDGATAIGLLIGNDTIAMPSGSEFITKTSAIIDLSKSHPISFNYNNDVLLNVLNPLKPGAYQLPPAADGIDTPLDGAGQMQCTTCHDPHQDTRVSSGENLPFWRHTVLVNGASTLYDEVCNSCHTAATAGAKPLHDLP